MAVIMRTGIDFPERMETRIQRRNNGETATLAVWFYDEGRMVASLHFEGTPGQLMEFDRQVHLAISALSTLEPGQLLDVYPEKADTKRPL